MYLVKYMRLKIELPKRGSKEAQRQEIKGIIRASEPSEFKKDRCRNIMVIPYRHPKTGLSPPNLLDFKNQPGTLHDVVTGQFRHDFWDLAAP